MKLIRSEVVVNAGNFLSTPVWQTIEENIRDAIHLVDWPAESGQFTIYPQRDGNGVVPIKLRFISHLRDRGWSIETRLDIGQRKKLGKLDAALPIKKDPSSFLYFAVEWETGNISSSHRALNKMALGIIRGYLIGGALVLPTRKLSLFLTQRVGNYEELEPYFDLWKHLNIKEGNIIVYAVEQDKVSYDVSTIPKGTDGLARR